MKQYKSHTLKEYLGVLSKKTPVPGGGSAAAYVGAMGVGLISMVAHYSKNSKASKSDIKKFDSIIAKCDTIKKRMLDLVDLDAKAYMKVVNSKKATKAVKKKALKEATKVPVELSKLCFKAVELTPYLVKKGNKYLISDIEIAIEMLLAAFNSSLINIEVNK